ncbi:MAG: amine dehydrogenase large subunit [Gemmatimonadales bacterium]
MPSYRVAGSKHGATVAILGLAWLLAPGLASPARAQFRADRMATLELPARPGPHWVWVNDIVFHHMADGKAFLLDGDSGNMLGMLSTGFGFTGLLVPQDGSAIVSPETYYSRGTRGTRTDVVTVYDPRTLSPIAEIDIPAKRAGMIPMPTATGLTDDGRFLLVYNFTPAQSVTVVDLTSRQFVGEIDTPGCAMVYPTGPRSFFSLCGDGTAFVVRLDDAGKATARSRTPKLFDPEADPVTEKAVRDRNAWLFVSFAGDVVPIESTADGVRAGARWPLATAAERQQGWRPGGLQHLALHVRNRRLYSLMHQGGPDTHKDPGSEIWVHDLATRQRAQRIPLEKPLTSIAVSSDANPLLFGVFIAAPELLVFDARTGALLRTVAEVGFTPSTLIAR